MKFDIEEGINKEVQTRIKDDQQLVEGSHILCPNSWTSATLIACYLTHAIDEFIDIKRNPQRMANDKQSND